MTKYIFSSLFLLINNSIAEKKESDSADPKISLEEDPKSFQIINDLRDQLQSIQDLLEINDKNQGDILIKLNTNTGKKNYYSEKIKNLEAKINEIEKNNESNDPLQQRNLETLITLKKSSEQILSESEKEIEETAENLKLEKKSLNSVKENLEIAIGNVIKIAEEKLIISAKNESLSSELKNVKDELLESEDSLKSLQKEKALSGSFIESGKIYKEIKQAKQEAKDYEENLLLDHRVRELEQKIDKREKIRPPTIIKQT